MRRVHAVGTPMPLQTGNEDRARSVGRTHHRRQMNGTTRTGHRDVPVWEIRRGDAGRVGFCDILVYIG